MKPFRWTAHAAHNLVDREIDRAEAERALASPDSVDTVRLPRKAYLRRYFAPLLQQEMLLRIIVEELPTEVVVVTLYKTSQLAKYLKGSAE